MRKPGDLPRGLCSRDAWYCPLLIRTHSADMAEPTLMTIADLLSVAFFQRQAIDPRLRAGCATSLNISLRQAHRVGQLAPLPRRSPEDCAHATVADPAPQDFRDRDRSPRSCRAGQPLPVLRRLSRANVRAAAGFGRIWRYCL